MCFAPCQPAQVAHTWCSLANEETRFSRSPPRHHFDSGAVNISRLETAFGRCDLEPLRTCSLTRRRGWPRRHSVGLIGKTLHRPRCLPSPAAGWSVKSQPRWPTRHQPGPTRRAGRGGPSRRGRGPLRPCRRFARRRSSARSSASVEWSASIGKLWRCSLSPPCGNQTHEAQP